MSDISKFLADIQRIKKHTRADNGGNYNGKQVCEQIVKLFVNNNRHVQDLAQSLADYWLNTYVFASEDLTNEPSEDNMNRISAFQYFIDGDADEDYSILDDDDWETLRDFANDEAENMDLDLLQGMMGIILNNGAL